MHRHDSVTFVDVVRRAGAPRPTRGCPAGIGGRTMVAMAVSMAKHMMSALTELRYQPTSKRIRVRYQGDLIADTTRAMLVWEPARVVPSYAVPEHDLAVPLRKAQSGPPPEYRPVGFGADGPPLLDPTVPFVVHSAAGEPVSVGPADGAGFRFADIDLAGYIELDFDAFEWWEEDEPVMSHPHDPFHRIDVRRSSRRVRIEDHGVVLAESDRACLLFEGVFPVIRYYLPPEDVQVRLTPGTLDTSCAYKGHATHYTAVLDGREIPNIAWSYQDPLTDAVDVAGQVAFYTERLDVIVDGRAVERVRTPWS
jgi:uncharacterized protein (DUF427 family)